MFRLQLFRVCVFRSKIGISRLYSSPECIFPECGFQMQNRQPVILQFPRLQSLRVWVWRIKIGSPRSCRFSECIIQIRNRCLRIRYFQTLDSHELQRSLQSVVQGILLSRFNQKCSENFCSHLGFQVEKSRCVYKCWKVLQTSKNSLFPDLLLIFSYVFIIFYIINLQISEIYT